LQRTRSPSFGAGGRGWSSVPNTRGRGERRLDDALKAVASALGAARAPWMVIGGIAVIARGVRRLTTDVDVVVRGDAIGIEALLRTLKRRQIGPRVDDAVEFARENLVLLLRHLASGVDVDLSLGWTAFEADAIAASTPAAYGSITVPMARVEDLIVFKAMAARPKDMEDAAALLLMHSGIDGVRVRRRLAELATLAGEPELIEGLERVMADVRKVRSAMLRRSTVKPRPKPTKRRPRAGRKE
jgi:hypothetical protein